MTRAVLTHIGRSTVRHIDPPDSVAGLTKKEGTPGKVGNGQKGGAEGHGRD